MTLSDHQATFLTHLSLLIQNAGARNIKMTGGELFRPQEMEDLYYKEGKSHTHNSNHTRRLAIDLNIFSSSGNLMTLEEIRASGLPDFWKSLDSLNRWGGDFSSLQDSPHFERNFLG